MHLTGEINQEFYPLGVYGRHCLALIRPQRCNRISKIELENTKLVEKTFRIEGPFFESLMFNVSSVFYI